MKKILLVALVICASYGTSLQGCELAACIPICVCGIIGDLIKGVDKEYKYLNKLPENSKIRSRCQKVRHAYIWPGATEIQCDETEKAFFDLQVQEWKNLRKKFENTESSKIKESISNSEMQTLATQEQELGILNLIKLILPDASDKEQEEELRTLISYSYKLPTEELFRRAQQKEKKDFQDLW